MRRRKRGGRIKISGLGFLRPEIFRFLKLIILKVDATIRSQTRIGERHRDHSTTGSTLKRKVNSALAVYFFGPNLDGKLSYESFLQFQNQLQNDILWIEVKI